VTTDRRIKMEQTTNKQTNKQMQCGQGHNQDFAREGRRLENGKFL